MSEPVAILDVAELPGAALDHRSPIWWGNVLMLMIESTMFVLLFASYFYLKQNFEHWPPPLVDRAPPVFNPVPFLTLPVIMACIAVLSLIPMAIVDRACMRMKETPVKIGLVVLVVLAAGFDVMEWFSLDCLRVKWDENAYGSVAWTLVGLHLLHGFVATGESALMAAWVLRHGLDKKHARDVRTTAIYWYWVTGLWLLVFLVVFVSPRVL
jgi:cytochrome c oxidase subunit 3